MKKQRFIFILNKKIYNHEAVSVTEDATILFKGNLDEKIPSDVKRQLDEQETKDDLEEKNKKEKSITLKNIIKNKSKSTKDRLEALVEHFNLDV